MRGRGTGSMLQQSQAQVQNPDGVVTKAGSQLFTARIPAYLWRVNTAVQAAMCHP